MARHADRVGQQVGEYCLLRWLGGGGFGDVYLAEHLREHTQVAIKVLQTRFTRQEDLKEFINEARMIHLKHSHIVSLLDFGIASDNTPFLVMAYAPHGTLRDRHPKGSRLPLSTIISYVKPLASALQHAHSLHLVHRDVKPENMLVGPSHEILLSDFGIVAVVHSSRSLSTEQGIGGTLPYMAPEQIAGKPRAASDQYALGIVVYEWITGRRPFTGTVAEIAIQHTTTPPPSLREQLPMLPIDVEQVVLKALAKDHKSRFANIEAFARALEQAWQQAEAPNPTTERSSLVRSPLPMQDLVSARPPTDRAHEGNPAVTDTRSSPLRTVSFSRMEGMALVTQPVDGPVVTPLISPAIPVLSRQEPPPSRLPPPGSPQRLRRGRLSWRRAALLLVLALLILGSAGGLFVTQYLYTTRSQATAKANAQVSSTANAFLTSTAQVYATTAAQVQPTARAAADAYARFVATNGIMFGFDAQHTHANPYERILNPTTVSGLTKKWAYQIRGYVESSPAVAGGVVYIGSDDGNLYALDAASGAKKWAYQTGSPVYSPAVVDGVVYVDSYGGNLYALDAVSGAKKWAYHIGSYFYSSPAVANGVVYIGSEDGNLYALDAASGAKKWAYHTPGSTPGSRGYSSSPAVAGGVVYVGSGDGNLYALDAATGAKKWAYRAGGFSSPTLEGGAIYISPAVAGGVVYVGSYDGNLYALDATTGVKKWAYRTGGPVYSSPAVAGGVVYVGSEDSNLYALDAATGAKKWAYRAAAGLKFSPPEVANGLVYVGVGWDNVYALDATSGAKRWAYQAGGDSSPAVANGMVYVSTLYSNVYAFHLPGT
jgi:eukaryotic-like serine/threonine-protein kinase